MKRIKERECGRDADPDKEGKHVEEQKALRKGRETHMMLLVLLNTGAKTEVVDFRQSGVMPLHENKSCCSNIRCGKSKII